MERSIQYFMEFGIKKIRKVIEKFITEEEMNIGEFVLELGKPLQELQREIIAETIENIDDVYRKSKYRTDRYVIERSNDSNSFISKQAIMKDVHSLEIPALIPEVKQKNRLKYYILMQMMPGIPYMMGLALRIRIRSRRCLR